MVRKRKALLGETYHVRLTTEQEDWLNENLKSGVPISQIMREALNIYIALQKNKKEVESSKEA